MPDVKPFLLVSQLKVLSVLYVTCADYMIYHMHPGISVLQAPPRAVSRFRKCAPSAPNTCVLNCLQFECPFFHTQRSPLP